MNARTNSYAFRATAASFALGAALLFAAPSFADDTTTQAAPAQNAQPGAKMAKTNHEDRVGMYLDKLHKQLSITAAQEPQWNAYAQVMRDNAAAMDQSAQQENQAIQARAGQKSMTAEDDLKAYEAWVDARAAHDQQYSDGLKKLVPAFDALYDSMSDQQKKKADTLFAQARERHEKHQMQHSNG
jgi:hypothetical protein